jgi:MoxR-like ATPase
MPGDLTGIDIFDPESHQFKFVKGPVFHEIVLADEINRAPPKVQSALLEAMAEHQVTVGGITRKLPDLFVVMATQNPLEQSGTYPLPEAQLDRFLLHIKLEYPTPDEELEILKLDRKHHYGEDKETIESPLTPETVLTARREVADIYVDEMLEKYIVSIVTATRSIGDLNKDWSEFLIAGASPRASIALLRAASAIAYINGRDHVIPEDILEIAPDVLRHRLILNYSALAANISADDIIEFLLSEISIP